MRVPNEAGNGKAKVTLTLSNWPKANIPSETFEVPIVDVQPASKGAPGSR